MNQGEPQALSLYCFFGHCSFSAGSPLTIFIVSMLTRDHALRSGR